MEKKYTLSEFGYTAVLGKYASQAAGAVWLQQGDSVVLATVVTDTARDFLGFFPLTVDYREQFSAAGKIPGGYLKREGRLSDQEVLVCRLMDRAIRPLFPENFFDKVQLYTSVYSADRESINIQSLALLASSLALVTSPVPFLSPVGSCEVARIDGEWVFNPSYEQTKSSDIRLLVAGTAEGINMVEGCTAEISEEEMVDLFFRAHEYVKKQIQWQLDVKRDWGVEDNPVEDTFKCGFWSERAHDFLTKERVARVFVADKVARGNEQRALIQEFYSVNSADIAPELIGAGIIEYVFDKVLKEELNEMIFDRGSRVDGRDFQTVRPISTQVGLLPRVHGSSLFTRGSTQALAMVTLGGGQDQMRIDGLMDDKSQPFMLHYNFPSFAVGEARPSRGPGRREIGHGHLAASALKPMLPSQEAFPYTMRIVVDILESDGSSSMATVCSSTMALMYAGVPLQKMVSGIAMGLLMNRAGEFRVLTDISGIEDAFGFMDFKVAGTDAGITAIQMDIKHKGGLKREVFEKALAQAKQGRLHILGEMRKVMTEPAAQVSSLVPQIVSVKVPKEKIGAVIGSGGKVIREITESTGTSIDIQDDGTVKIFGKPGEQLDRAVAIVKIIGGQLAAGDRHPGIVRRAAEFGLFVELAPGVDGLVHVSTVPRNDQQAFLTRFKEGEAVMVDVLDYDKSNGRIRLKIVE